MSQHQHFAQLLLWAAQREAGVAREYPKKVLAVYERLNNQFPRIDERRLEALSGQAELDLLASGRFVYLEANKKASWCIPVLTVKYDFTTAGAEMVRLRLALCGLVTDSAPLKAIGMRFESPEGAGGLHHYYHVQLIDSFSKGVEEHQIPGIGWVPVRFPAVPVDANSPTTLLLGFLLSLYGLNFLKAMREAGFSREFWNSIAGLNYMAELEAEQAATRPNRDV